MIFFNRLILLILISIAPLTLFGKPRNLDMDAILEQLELKPEQKSQIKKIYNIEKEKHKEIRKIENEARKNFFRGISDPKISNEKLTALHEIFISKKVDEMRSYFNKMIQIRSILNEKQIIKFNKLMKKRRKKHRGKFKKRKKVDKSNPTP